MRFSGNISICMLMAAGTILLPGTDISYAMDSVLISLETAAVSLGENIQEDGGPVTAVCVWRNVSSSPVVLLNASTTCGCLSVKYVRRTVDPGESDTLSLEYRPKGHAGRFSHKVFLYAGESHGRPAASLDVTGTVRPASVPVWRYPVQMGDIFLKRRDVYVDGDRKQVEAIECLNAGDRPFTLDTDHSLVPPCVRLAMEPATVQPGETADIVFFYEPDGNTDLRRIPVILGGIDLPPGQRTLFVIVGQKPEVTSEVL